MKIFILPTALFLFMYSGCSQSVKGQQPVEENIMLLDHNFCLFN